MSDRTMRVFLLGVFLLRAFEHRKAVLLDAAMQ